MKDNKSNPHFLTRSVSIVGSEYAQLLHELKDSFRKAHIKAAVRVNSELLEFYWEMGRKISILKAASKWGSAFYDSLSLDLRADFPNETGFSVRNIRYIARWFNFYSQDNLILQRLVAESSNTNPAVIEMPNEFGLIPWGQHIEIITKCKSVAEALFYIEQTIEGSWSRPRLKEEIEANLYARHGKAITNFDERLPKPYSGLAKEIIKSPYNFNFIEKSIHSERDLEDELATNITRFLLELGQGFAYVGRQMQLIMPNGKTYIPDMVFYHYRLKAFVICELKYTEFKPEYAGKLNFYVSAVDDLLRQPDDNPTIGLLICKSKDNTEVEWAFRGMSQPIGVAEFEHKAAQYLPTAEQLQRIIETYHPSDDQRKENP